MIEKQATQEEAARIGPAEYAVRMDGAFARATEEVRPGEERQETPPRAEKLRQDGWDTRSEASADRDRSPLLDPLVVQRLRDDWQEAQYDFVDDPHQAVERADAIVVRAARRLAEAVLERNADVRKGWCPTGPGSAAQDTGTSTEQLRVALQQYRDVLDRVLDL
ncbi:hypothetical protein [Streptacidiphilus jiangxiensis]|uniref:Uncharacterized protein n=1 Tax=Streptacidiphilus jiangxiensis TaxID=235985 RepID=A0A1H7H6R9_STRJI|nr:hypothetical protein [Streptacidiphilus jiangxiensis]SEK45959.1 hypothetical protein SAMN05414137_10298 [Streptacidiphilus jiangxiensis]